MSKKPQPEKKRSEIQRFITSRTTAGLCLLNESDKSTNGPANRFPPISGTYGIHSLGVHSANHIQLIESGFVGNVVSKFNRCGGDFYRDLVGMCSGFYFSFQGEVMNSHPAGDNKERSDFNPNQCYRHGRWVGRGESHVKKRPNWQQRGNS